MERQQIWKNIVNKCLGCRDYSKEEIELGVINHLTKACRQVLVVLGNV